MRSSYYDDLVTAEARAVKNGKGLHGKTDPPLHKITEVTTKTQSDRFLPAFRVSVFFSEHQKLTCDAATW